MADPIDTNGTASAMAALSICESLLIALSDLKVISAREAAGILNDAASVHRNADGATDGAAMHLEVAAIIDRITVAGTSVQRP